MKKTISVLMLFCLLLTVLPALATADIPEAVTEFQTEFFRVMELNNVIIVSKDTEITTTETDEPVTSYKCTPYNGMSISASYQNDLLISYTANIDANIDYAYDKFPETGLAFFMGACQYNKDNAYAVLEYLISNLADNGPLGKTSELERDDFTVKMVYTPIDTIILAVYPK